MRLKTSRKVRRRRLAVELGHARKIMRQLKLDSAEALMEYCQDKNQGAHNQLRACGALACLLHRTAVPFLLRLADDKEQCTADAALHGLRTIGTRRATRRLIRELRNPTTDARRQAAPDALRFLGDRRSERAVSHVLLTDQCAQTRELAAEVLGYVHQGRRSVQVLIEALSDPSPEVRWWALASLTGEPHLHQSDLVILRECLSDHSTVSGLDSPEKATVAWAARKVLESLDAREA